VVGAVLVGLVAAVCVGPGGPAANAAFPGENGAIVFESQSVAGDHTQTDVIEVENDETHVLTHTADKNEFGPAWNAAGKRIAFWRTKAPFGPGNLWVMQGDGSHQRRLTDGVDARDPAWNPGGDRLIYTQVGSGQWDLYSLRVFDGGDRHQLTQGSALDFEAAWSPVGRFIAFTRGFATGDVGDIYLLDLRNHHVTQVTDSAGYDHQAAWSPDGTRLVFERDFDRRNQICSVKPDGTGLVVLAGGPHFDIGPAYSPDGTKIAFGSDRATDSPFHDIWVMNADGSNKHRLVELPDAADGFPDWQPV
jgi:Tol biopolymer transport system component